MAETKKDPSTKQIYIKCKGNRTLNINQLKNFQGNLKELKEKEYIKLKNSILKYGFSFPVIVWENNIIDGHQRIFAVKKMISEEGYNIDNIPVADIEADSEKEAKKKLLIFNSQYGKIDDQGLYEFIENSGINFDDFKEEMALPDFDMDYFNDNFYNDKNFDAGTIEEQGQLDQLEPKIIICPYCEKEFDIRGKE